MTDSIVYICGVCQQQLASADFVVQTVRIEEIHPVGQYARTTGGRLEHPFTPI